MRLLLTALILLFSVSAWSAPPPDKSPDILWQIRPAEWIDRLGITFGMEAGIGGLAWHGRAPCIVMTPPPPLPDARQLEVRAWLRLIHHELRHCREGFFHGGGPEKK